VDFDMECLEPCTTEEGFRYMSDEEHRWSVRCIPRLGGHSGMSGGWRGVAIDHALTTNDSIVMEVVRAAQPIFVRLHVFRAEIVPHA